MRLCLCFGTRSGSQLLALVWGETLNVYIASPLQVVPSGGEAWTGEEPRCALVWLLTGHLQGHGSKEGHSPPNLNVTLVAYPKTYKEHPAVPRGELAQNCFSRV